MSGILWKKNPSEQWFSIWSFCLSLTSVKPFKFSAKLNAVLIVIFENFFFNWCWLSECDKNYKWLCISSLVSSHLENKVMMKCKVEIAQFYFSVLKKQVFEFHLNNIKPTLCKKKKSID